jgi:dynein heavy chain
MKSSLDMLIRAIDGTVVMSLDLEIMGNMFIDNKMPPRWEAPLGYPSLKPLGSWVDDLIKRLEFMANWWYNGSPDTYWISAFFFPQGFMTASL